MTFRALALRQSSFNPIYRQHLFHHQISYTWEKEMRGDVQNQMWGLRWVLHRGGDKTGPFGVAFKEPVSIMSATTVAVGSHLSFSGQDLDVSTFTILVRQDDMFKGKAGWPSSSKSIVGHNCWSGTLGSSCSRSTVTFCHVIYIINHATNAEYQQLTKMPWCNRKFLKRLNPDLWNLCYITLIWQDRATCSLLIHFLCLFSIRLFNFHILNCSLSNVWGAEQFEFVCNDMIHESKIRKQTRNLTSTWIGSFCRFGSPQVTLKTFIPNVSGRFSTDYQLKQVRG